jgi:hypothetical protein
MPKNFLGLCVSTKNFWMGSVTRNEKKYPIDSQTFEWDSPGIVSLASEFGLY